MNDIVPQSRLLDRLAPRERRGSKPRCHRFTHGENDSVAARLTSLIAPWGRVSVDDRWMPVGFDAPEEAQLHTAPRILPSAEERAALRGWWLADPRPTSRTPHWDIVSTCSINGERGLLLVEAKAHCDELRGEERGKRITSKTSENNHRRIAEAIDEANSALRTVTNIDWHLASDRYYQMSNRFAWAWKLCTLGYSVALVYLGFIGASEMIAPFTDAATWDRLVRGHSACLFPDDVWNRSVLVGRRTFLPLIRSETVPLPS